MKKTLSAILAILMLITCFVSVVIPASAETITCNISGTESLKTALKSKTGSVVWNIKKDFAIIKKNSVTFTDSCDLVIEGNGHTLTCSSGIATVFDAMFGFATKISEDKHVTITINNLNLVTNEKFKHVIISNIGTVSSHGITMILNNVTIDHINSAEGGGNCAIINNSGDLTLKGNIVISTGINSYSAIDNDNARGQASLTIASGANLTINDNRIFTERMRNPVIQSDMGGSGVNMRFANYSSAKLVPVQRAANAGYEFGETLDTTNTKELDMNYNVDVRDAWTDVTKVKLTWVIEEVNATYTSRKVWNPDKLSWDEVREDASAPTANAAFTVVNFSSKEIIASAAFTVVEDEDVKATFSSATYTNNGKRIGTVVNTDHTIDEEKKASIPGNTIGAAIEFHEDKFTALDATTEAAKYGTFTITIAEAGPCEVCKALDDHAAKLFETFGITTYVGLIAKTTAEINAVAETYLDSVEFAQLESLALSGQIAQGEIRFYKADCSYDLKQVSGTKYVCAYIEYYCVDHPEKNTFVPAG